MIYFIIVIKKYKKTSNNILNEPKDCVINTLENAKQISPTFSNICRYLLEKNNKGVNKPDIEILLNIINPLYLHKFKRVSANKLFSISGKLKNGEFLICVITFKKSIYTNIGGHMFLIGKDINTNDIIYYDTQRSPSTCNISSFHCLESIYNKHIKHYYILTKKEI